MSLKGKIIVLEGTDGSGKQTQTELLKRRLEENEYSVYSCAFPNYDSDSSMAVKMYLNGNILKKSEDVSAKAASIFYAVDRYITFKKEIEDVYKEKEKVILFDRWVTSNIIHQGQKLISSIYDEEEKKEALKQFITWLDNLEHGDLEIPKADITIFLNVPYEYTIQLRKNRANKITKRKEQDLHEKDENHLKNASMTALMAADMLHWEKIDCIKEERLRTKEEIADEIWTTICNKLK